MTYHTFKCPYCNNVVGKATGDPSRIGNPLRKCPWCHGIYVDTFTEEWIMKSSWKRFKFFIEKPFGWAMITFLVVFGLLAANEIDFFICLTIGSVDFILVFIFVFFLVKEKLDIEITKSLNRTKNARYVKKLLAARLKIYPIKGVEIGTEMNEDEISYQLEIKEQIDKTFNTY